MYRIAHYASSCHRPAALLAVIVLSACGDNIGSNGADKVNFTISGTVTSQTLTAETVKLQLNNGNTEQMEVSSTSVGSWTFGGLDNGQTYTVSVAQAPAHEQCTPQSLQVTINGSDVPSSQLAFQCTPITTANVAVSVSSFPSSGFVLHVTYSNPLFSAQTYDQKVAVSKASLTTPLTPPMADGSSYQVTIEEPPIASVKTAVEHCLVLNPASGIANGSASTLALTVQCSYVGRFIYAAADNLGPTPPAPNAPEHGAFVGYSIQSATGSLAPILDAQLQPNVVPSQFYPGPLTLVPNTLAPNPQKAQGTAFAYAVDYGADPTTQQYALSQYTIDNKTGVLSVQTPASVSLGVKPADRPVALDSLGTNAYITQTNVVNTNGVPTGPQIFAFPITSGGTLGTVVPYPQNNAPCIYPSGFTVIPGCLDTAVGNPVVNGSYAYQVSAKGNPSGYLTVYAVDSATGNLVLQGDPIFFNLESARYLTVRQIGNNTYAYLLADTSCPYQPNPNKPTCTNKPPGVLVFKLDATTGLPSVVNQTAASDSGVVGSPGVFSPLLIDKSGNYAFVINGEASSITVYQINQTDGSLTPATGSPFQTGGYTTTAINMALDPSGRFLYTVFSFTNSIAAYSINLPSPSQPDALTLVGIYQTAGAPNSGVQSIAIEPAGKYLYVSNQGSISGFFIDPNTGGLTPVVGTPFAPPPSPLLTDPNVGPVYFTSITVMP